MNNEARIENTTSIKIRKYEIWDKTIKCVFLFTARKVGLMATQQNLQKIPGVNPSMALTSLLNLLMPERKQEQWSALIVIFLTYGSLLQVPDDNNMKSNIILYH